MRSLMMRSNQPPHSVLVRPVGDLDGQASAKQPAERYTSLGHRRSSVPETSQNAKQQNGANGRHEDGR